MTTPDPRQVIADALHRENCGCLDFDPKADACEEYEGPTAAVLAALSAAGLAVVEIRAVEWSAIFHYGHNPVRLACEDEAAARTGTDPKRRYVTPWEPAPAEEATDG